MSSKEVVKRLTVENELSTCPECGYTDGFHVSFNMVEHKRAEVVLICPSCHKRFRIGWEVVLK
ncbi:MAG: hypothetical protein D6828_01925 [Nitrospirae bacterium]|nr:MAG: hypothetical protein D6828_01925 [Nitrospirota bacterium]